MNLQSLETELWEAADQLRANSKLTAAFSDAEILSLHQAYERAFPTELPLNWAGVA